jgi:hypothetical protein
MSKAQEQIDKLANFIMAKVPGEPSENEGAVDTAIRIMSQQLEGPRKETSPEVSSAAAHIVARIRAGELEINDEDSDAIMVIAMSALSQDETKGQE